MHCPTAWATEVEIFSAAQVLDADIFLFAKSGHCHKWLQFQSSVATDSCSYKHSKQSLYLTNITITLKLSSICNIQYFPCDCYGF